MAMPSSGTKKIKPNSRPQNDPLSAPAPVRLFSWRVLGFFAPSGHDTIAASWTLISSSFCSCSSVASARSAPLASGNFHTVNVAMSSTSE